MGGAVSSFRFKTAPVELKIEILGLLKTLSCARHCRALTRLFRYERVFTEWCVRREGSGVQPRR